jgi:uncharacterized protein YecT (DUF1311 family)
MRTIAALLLAAVFATTLQAAEESPIDKKLAACMESDPSTAGTIECIGEAYASWDRELNAAYQSLMKRLSPAQQDSLRKSQRQWVAWRDAEFETLDLIYGDLQGTMFLPMRVDDRMQIVKARARALRSYESLLTLDE